MRKNAGFMIMTLLLLTVPALANAWTLAVKVAGGTDTNKVSVAYGTPAVSKDFKSTISHLYPVGKVTVTAASGFTSMTLDGQAIVNGVQTPTSGDHTLEVIYNTTQADHGLTLVQASGGQIYAQNRNNTWSSVDVTGFLAGAALPVTIAADANHKIVSYSLDGGAAISTGVTGAAGQVLSLMALANNQNVTATFGIAARTSVSLFAPTDAYTSNSSHGSAPTNAIVCSATATSNDSGLVYVLTVSPSVTGATQVGQTLTFAPTAAGTYTVTAKVTSDHDLTVGTTATAKINVTSNQGNVNQGCVSCHSTQSPTIVTNYTASIHNQSTSSSCAACHNADAPHSANVNAANVNPATFVVISSAANGIAKKAIFCTACHTGNYPIPHATANLGATCAACHTGTTGTDGKGDAHVIKAPSNLTSLSNDLCVNCHGQATKGNPTASIVAGYNASIHKAGETYGSSCAGCHSGSHDAALHASTSNVDPITFLTKTATVQVVDHGITTTLPMGAIFCTGCHTGAYPIPHATTGLSTTCAGCHTLGGTGDAHNIAALPGGVVNEHFGSPTQMITANGAVDNVLKGWDVAKTGYLSQGAICADCHNSTNSVIAGFAKGAHGEISNDNMNPFVHYNWANPSRTNNGTRQNGNCDRCHTSYGFLKFANQTTGLTRLQLKIGVKGDASTAENVLVCVGCHSSIETGALRTNATPSGNNAAGKGAGQALTGGYFALFSSAGTAVASGKTKIQIAFPGYKNSSICIPCHSGRTTADVFVANLDFASTANKNYSTVSTSYYQHGKNMAQTFIGAGGYDYVGNLAKVEANGHANVKNSASDTQGPCVGCHYSTAGQTHSLEVTGYASCQACHMSGFGAANVAAAKANFDAGVKVLDALIRSKLNPLRVDQTLDLSTERANVRFGRFNKAAGTGADITTAKNAYGAWYNWQILETYDNAAYVHNPAYARQLLLDTIDYLDDGAVNGTAVATINASSAITAPELVSAITFTKDVGCSGCHLATNDPYAANNIIATYNASGHSNNAHGPTCASCHSGANAGNHPTSLAGDATMLDGYSATGAGAACISCHNGSYSRLFGTATHFTNATTAAFHNVSAAYVGYKGKGINACATCHFKLDPHGIGAGTVGEATFSNNSDILGAWAESGHGERTGLAWVPSSSHDWRNLGSTVDFSANTPVNDCVRCHTAAGFAQFATSGLKNIASVGAADGQKFNAPLTCGGCHVTDASGSASAARIAVPQVQTFYNISTVDKNTKLAVKARITANFPDVGDSNICNSCHSGRLSGNALVAAVGAGLSLNNSGFQNSHYMAASGTMYTKTGFVNFTSLSAATGTSTVNYGRSLLADNVSTPDGIASGLTSTHRNLGTARMHGDSHNPTFFVSGNLDQNGPCVTCHMNANNNLNTERDAAGHSLAIGADAYNQVCINCHATEGSASGPVALTASNFVANFLEPNGSAFQNSLNLAKTLLLSKYNISYNPDSYPYFYDENLPLKNGAKQAVTDWTRAGALTNAAALKLEGACLNVNLFSREPASYVHARSYTRRLIYDTIDFLDDGVMNASTVATAHALDAANFTAGPTAYTLDNGAASTLGTFGAGTTEGMLYLKGWNRTTGAWVASPERP
jgi:hypothetical protein